MARFSGTRSANRLSKFAAMLLAARRRSRANPKRNRNERQPPAPKGFFTASLKLRCQGQIRRNRASGTRRNRFQPRASGMNLPRRIGLAAGRNASSCDRSGVQATSKQTSAGRDEVSAAARFPRPLAAASVSEHIHAKRPHPAPEKVVGQNPAPEKAADF